MLTYSTELAGILVPFLRVRQARVPFGQGGRRWAHNI